MKIKTIAKCGLIAALYTVVTLALAPISFGPLQLRVSELLKPLALFDPTLAIAFCVGVGLGNMASPFGVYDWMCMPFIAFIAAYMCYILRRYSVIALIVQSAFISVGVALFPLGFGAKLPFIPTFSTVFTSELTIMLFSWFVIWKPREELLRQVLVTKPQPCEKFTP